jgi:hypothetical protein
MHIYQHRLFSLTRGAVVFLAGSSEGHRVWVEMMDFYVTTQS